MDHLGNCYLLFRYCTLRTRNLKKSNNREFLNKFKKFNLSLIFPKLFCAYTIIPNTVFKQTQNLFILYSYR